MITLQLNKKDLLVHWVPFGIIILILFIAYPLTLSIIGGYFLYPLTNLLHKKFKLPVFISVLLTVVFILSSILLILFVLIQTLIDLIPFIHEHVVLLPVLELQNHPIFMLFEGKFQTLLNKILNDLMLNLTHLPSYFFETFLFSIGLFFSLSESLKDREWFLVYFPKKVRHLCHRALLKSSTIVNKFLQVELKLFVITFVIISIGFSVLGLHNPIKYAFLISLVDSIPFLGTGLILIPLGIYFFLMEMQMEGTIILLLYIFVQLTRHILESVLWSSSMQIKAVHVFYLSAAAILIFGFIGILFSPFIYLFAHKWDSFKKTSSQ